MLQAVLSITLLALAGGILLGHRSMGDPVSAEDAGMAAPRMPPPSVAPLPKALQSGLVFNHVPKTGGSTFGGIMRRIAYRRGLAHARDHAWLGKEAPSEPRLPAVYADHGKIVDVGQKLRSRLPGAFWVTLLRDPISRCFSSFYHLLVTREGVPPTEENKKLYIRENCSADLETKTVSPGRSTSSEEILASYGFVAVTERFDASLILLAKRLGIDQVDMLYLRSKDAGSGKDPLTGRPMAEHPPLDREPASLQIFARASLAYGPDARLLLAANQALDREIDAYGVPRFEQDLKTFQTRLRIVAEQCEAHFWTACLYDDSGCGQDCIESVAKKFRWA